MTPEEYHQMVKEVLLEIIRSDEGKALITEAFKNQKAGGNHD